MKQKRYSESFKQRMIQRMDPSELTGIQEFQSFSGRAFERRSRLAADSFPTAPPCTQTGEIHAKHRAREAAIANAVSIRRLADLQTYSFLCEVVLWGVKWKMSGLGHVEMSCSRYVARACRRPSRP